MPRRCGSRRQEKAEPSRRRRSRRRARCAFLDLNEWYRSKGYAGVVEAARAATLADRLLYQVPGRGTGASGFPASEISAARNYGFVFAASLRIIANRTPASARPVSTAFAALT